MPNPLDATWPPVYISQFSPCATQCRCDVHGPRQLAVPRPDLHLDGFHRKVFASRRPTPPLNAENIGLFDLAALVQCVEVELGTVFEPPPWLERFGARVGLLACFVVVLVVCTERGANVVRPYWIVLTTTAPASIIWLFIYPTIYRPIVRISYFSDSPGQQQRPTAWFSGPARCCSQPVSRLVNDYNGV